MNSKTSGHVKDVFHNSKTQLIQFTDCQKWLKN